MTGRWVFLLVLSSMAATGCGGDSEPGMDAGVDGASLDGGEGDATPADGAGPVDAWTAMDAGTPMDAGPMDAPMPVDAAMVDAPDAWSPPDTGPPDAGPPDTGPPDTGPPDTGPPDAGPPDTGPPDTGPPDTGPPDTGPPDGGTPPCSSTPVRVTNNPGGSTDPIIVWDGVGYGVAWSDTRDGNSEIYFARLDAAGAVIGAAVRVTNDVADSEGLSVAWSGTEYVLAWYDLRDGNYEIYLARMDATGAKIGGDIRLTNDAGRSWGPSIAWTGTGYGVAWWENRGGNDDVYFARTDAAGVKMGGDVRVTTSGDLGGTPSLVWNGGGYGVAWSDRRFGSTELYFVRIDAAGATVGSEVRVTNATGASSLPSMVWNGSGYGLGWEDSRGGAQELYFVRLDSAGAKIGSDTAVSRRLFTPWNLVWTGSGYAMAWSDSRDGNLEIYFARLDASGARIGTDVRITTESATSRGPSLAWTGSSYGVSWGDLRDGRWEIYFAPICP